MVGWHHRFYRLESEQAPGVMDREAWLLRSMGSQSQTRLSD